MSKSDELPVDINYQQLTQWLVSRRKIPKDWFKEVKALQQKVAQELKLISPVVLNKVSGGVPPPLDYFTAFAILNELAPTAERNFFGGLGGSAGAWEKLVKNYEAKAARSIVQDTDYEIPALRKQNERLLQQVTDLERKKAECLKSSAVSARAYKEECEKWGISGDNISQGLKAITTEVPQMFASLLGFLREPLAVKAATYYSTFNAFAHTPPPKRDNPDSQEGCLLPLVQKIQNESGGLAAVRNHCRQSLSSIDDREQNSVSGLPSRKLLDDVPIDSSSLSTLAVMPSPHHDLQSLNVDLAASPSAQDNSEASVAINWDFDVEPEAGADSQQGTEQADSLNWSLGASQTEATSTSNGVTGGDIDWDIDIQEEADATAGHSSHDPNVSLKQQDEATMYNNEMQHEELFNIDADLRSNLLMELLELRAFLRQRRAEQSATSIAASQGAEFIDLSTIDKMLLAVNRCLEELESVRFRDILRLASSKRYQERVESNLIRRAAQERKMLEAAQTADKKRADLQRIMVQHQIKMKAMAKRIDKIKSRVEATLMEALDDRKVYILGDVNTTLAQLL